MKHLIVNADDFGLSPGVSRGIALAAKNGVVTSTTIMGNMPDLESHLELLKETQTGLGIHLVLTAGKPLLASHLVQSLVDSQGKFSRNFLQAVHLAKPEELIHEWRAQIKHVLSLGVVPSHLDSHHHVHMSSKLMPIAITLAKEFGIPAVRRFTLRDVLREQDLKTCLPIGITVMSSVRTLSRSSLKYPRNLIALNEAGLDYLARLGPGVYEMFCHPGVVDEELRGKSSLLETREQELAMLTAPKTRERIIAAGFSLVSYGVLGRGSL